MTFLAKSDIAIEAVLNKMLLEIMKKVYLLLAILFASNSIIKAQPSSKQKLEKPTIALLGTFHFAGSSDAMSLKTDDLTSPKRQNEIKDLVEALAEYKPTKVVLEYPYGATGLDSIYQLYLKGSHNLTINERQQIGFRLAKKMGHKHIFVADHHLDLPFDTLINFLQKEKQMNLFENMMSDMKTQVMDVLQKAYDNMTIKEFFVMLNNEKYDALNRNVYLEYVNKMGTDSNYLGSEVIAKWWERNFKIMFNIDAITELDDRVLVFFGQGHTSILKDFYKNRNDVSYTNINNIIESSNKIFTTDIDNFWEAYDSIQTTKEYSKKIDLINQLYLNKGSNGLKAFMKARDYNDTLYVKMIDIRPKFLNSIRQNTLSIKSKIKELNDAIAYLKKLYPELKDAEMYFTIGGLRSGGTVKGNMVLIGAEIATGNPTTDVSEFKGDWLKNVFASQSQDNFVSLNIHEYIHTQQNGSSKRVLNQTIKEGSADFIAELVMQKPLERNYMEYGRENTKKIKQLFKKEMLSTDFSNWLYNGSQKKEGSDLGYYVGYEICKAYYNNSKNKSQAIKDIIQLNYNDDDAIEAFLKKSKF